MGAVNATELVSPIAAKCFGEFSVFAQFAEAEGVMTFGEADAGFIGHQ